MLLSEIRNISNSIWNKKEFHDQLKDTIIVSVEKLAVIIIKYSSLKIRSICK
jgi:hypothetical protein